MSNAVFRVTLDLFIFYILIFYSMDISRKQQYVKLQKYTLGKVWVILLCGLTSSLGPLVCLHFNFYYTTGREVKGIY